PFTPSISKRLWIYSGALLRSSLSWKFWFSPSGNVSSILTFMECGLGVGSIETIFIVTIPFKTLLYLILSKVCQIIILRALSYVKSMIQYITIFILMSILI